ncbi:AAA family ATPase [Paenibacillus filicis]|uniref:AAA family ATPase n=1 Tax=Paenibacillus filicis TaxID=669464 RepID=A0ABU9DRA4_9BACL
MTIVIRKAERKVSKARVALAGPSGSGKTLSALLLAYGMTGDWEKIGLIDTENKSADVYAETIKAGVPVGSFIKVDLEAPYTTEKYIEAIKALEDYGVEAIITDSMSHAWAGEGGLLEQVDAAAGSGNKFTAWGKITPKHNRLIETILRSKCHIISTLRSKTEYVLVENDRGKKEPQKVGMAPIQRDGLEYEYTIMFDMNIDKFATANKDRTGLFEGQSVRITPEHGEQLLAWLQNGVELIKSHTVIAINTKWIELGYKQEHIDVQTKKTYGELLGNLTEPQGQDFLVKLFEMAKPKQQQSQTAEGA